MLLFASLIGAVVLDVFCMVWAFPRCALVVVVSALRLLVGTLGRLLLWFQRLVWHGGFAATGLTFFQVLLCQHCFL